MGVSETVGAVMVVLANAISDLQGAKRQRVAEVTDKAFSHSGNTQVLDPNTVLHRQMIEGGECALDGATKPIFTEEISPRKANGKNIMMSFPFKMPILDKYKELGEDLCISAK